jgi:hypothetical protein
MIILVHKGVFPFENYNKLSHCHMDRFMSIYEYLVIMTTWITSGVRLFRRFKLWSAVSWETLHFIRLLRCASRLFALRIRRRSNVASVGTMRGRARYIVRHCMTSCDTTDPIGILRGVSDGTRPYRFTVDLYLGLGLGLATRNGTQAWRFVRCGYTRSCGLLLDRCMCSIECVNVAYRCRRGLKIGTGLEWAWEGPHQLRIWTAL